MHRNDPSSFKQKLKRMCSSWNDEPLKDHRGELAGVSLLTSSKWAGIILKKNKLHHICRKSSYLANSNCRSSRFCNDSKLHSVLDSRCFGYCCLPV